MMVFLGGRGGEGGDFNIRTGEEGEGGGGWRLNYSTVQFIFLLLLYWIIKHVASRHCAKQIEKEPDSTYIWQISKSLVEISSRWMVLTFQKSNDLSLCNLSVGVSSFDSSVELVLYWKSRFPRLVTADPQLFRAACLILKSRDLSRSL